MKKGIHPNWHKNAKVVVNGKTVMTVGSTVEEINVEMWSGNHPFYTGKQLLVDTDNLVEKFNKKREQAEKNATKLRTKKEKRSQRRRSSSVSDKPVTLKDMLKNVE
jgi:large subunit ribosomal protein L31